mmetsp:Transcript_33780/g.76460  ORF Transcript_33780/g.76460 Transcript_33780/m.76460 type:complete len:117 (+) Transcript_33780:176-526(+)
MRPAIKHMLGVLEATCAAIITLLSGARSLPVRSSPSQGERANLLLPTVLLLLVLCSIFPFTGRSTTHYDLAGTNPLLISPSKLLGNAPGTSIVAGGFSDPGAIPNSLLGDSERSDP